MRSPLVGMVLFGALGVFLACSASDGATPTTEDGGPPSGQTSSSSSGGETQIDAGCTTGCSTGSACTNDDQCEGKCADGACTAPTTTDGKKSPSLGETDVDCGGPTAPPCAEGLGCAADSDCVTKACGAAKTCVSAPSCKGSNGPAGIETCGTAEPGAQGAKNESCCKSLPLPKTTTRRLDRYEITAGRFREFMKSLADANGGVPNLRAFAKTFATQNPTSQLGKVLTGFPGFLDILPDKKLPDDTATLANFLGAFPVDAMNRLDGCYVGTDSYGHATYWQPADDLKAVGVGYGASPNGIRKYGREVLDVKSLNCVMPVVLAAFCAWDGGELARTSDYYEIWGRKSVAVANGAATKTVFIPWANILSVGKFNWRNGAAGACNPISWPGCQTNQPIFYQFPLGGAVPLSDDESPLIGAPGRFPDDITAITSANGEGWFDVAGNMLEAAWPVGAVTPSARKDVCDTTSPTVGANACARTFAASGSLPAETRAGTRRFTGDLPHIALIGYSFEGHTGLSEAFLGAPAMDESKGLSLTPVTFQYGKVSGRCARSSP